MCPAVDQQLPARVEQEHTEGTVEQGGATTHQVTLTLGGCTEGHVSLVHQDARLLQKGQLLWVNVFLHTLLPLLAAAAAAAVTVLRLKAGGEARG